MASVLQIQGGGTSVNSMCLDLYDDTNTGFGFDRRFKATRLLFSAGWVSPLPYLFFFLLLLFSLASLMKAVERHAVLVSNRKLAQYMNAYVFVGFCAFWLLQSAC
jgi:hypothetical protein